MIAVFPEAHKQILQWKKCRPQAVSCQGKFKLGNLSIPRLVVKQKSKKQVDFE